MSPLLNQRFRANPAYELLLPEQLNEDDFAPSASLAIAGTLYGYLRPRLSSSLACRPVSADTALLFLTLGSGGRVPDYFRAHPGQRSENFLLRLVLDAVLEVEHEGTFVSGRAASERLLGNQAPSGMGRNAELSIEALRYAEALGELTIPELTRRIYDFGRRPMTRARQHALRLAGMDQFGEMFDVARQALSAHWIRTALANSHWIMWRPIRHGGEGECVRFKLYVSPAVGEIARALRAAAEVLGNSSGIRGLKLGRGIDGVCRPDKLVAYFSRLDDLQEVGLRLQRELEGCPVHGVPFTAELSRDGLLSWGADPPRTATSQGGSWRLWLAGRLATYLDAARRTHSRGASWRFALERLRLDGVNPDTWMPEADFWSLPGVAA
jgi:hypothetical protein